MQEQNPMKLFKMIGQILENEPQRPVKLTKTEEEKVANLVNRYNAKYLYQPEASSINPTETPRTTVVKSNDSGANNPIAEGRVNQPKGKENTCYVLFAPSGDKLLVLNNKVKQEMKLYGISHSDKNHAKAKRASFYINDLVKKKTVYFEEIQTENNVEYKIYLDKEKTTSLNSLLLKENLHTSEKNYLVPTAEKSDFVPAKVEQVETYRKPGLPVGRFVKGERAAYLFDKSNSTSYVVTLLNEDKTEHHWGVGLKNALDDMKVQPGDLVELHNLGQQLVTVDVPIKDENNKVIRHELQEVKRNTWNIVILERNHTIAEPVVVEKPIAQAPIKNSGAVQESISVKAAEKKERENCYALFSTSANTFVCMHNNHKQTYKLNNVEVENSAQPQVKKYLNDNIGKKVIFIEFPDKENENLVDIYLSKDATLSLNSQINNLPLPKKTEEKELSSKPIKPTYSEKKLPENKIDGDMPHSPKKVYEQPINIDDDIWGDGYTLEKPPSEVSNQRFEESLELGGINLDSMPPIDEIWGEYEANNSGNSIDNSMPPMDDSWAEYEQSNNFVNPPTITEQHEISLLETPKMAMDLPNAPIDATMNRQTSTEKKKLSFGKKH